jgi:hypothetical protein
MLKRREDNKCPQGLTDTCAAEEEGDFQGQEAKTAQFRFSEPEKGEY